MRRLSGLFLMVLLVGMASSVHGQSSVPDRNLILTEGEAEAAGQNDSAGISLSIVTEGRKLVQVSEENARKTEKVVKALKALKIRKFKLKTGSYRVTPKRDYKIRPPKIRGYEVRNTITVTLEGHAPGPLSLHISRIVGRALEQGANNIQAVHLYIKDKGHLEREALRQATRKAMDKVRVLAEAAGVKLKRLVSLSTHPVSTRTTPPLVRMTRMKAESEAVAPPIETGESVIRVRVEVVYEIK